MKQTIIQGVASAYSNLLNEYQHHKTMGHTDRCASLARQISNYAALLKVADQITEDHINESMGFCGEHCTAYRILLIANNMRLFGIESIKKMEGIR